MQKKWSFIEVTLKVVSELTNGIRWKRNLLSFLKDLAKLVRELEVCSNAKRSSPALEDTKLGNVTSVLDTKTG